MREYVEVDLANPHADPQGTAEELPVPDASFDMSPGRPRDPRGERRDRPARALLGQPQPGTLFVNYHVLAERGS